MSVVGSEVDLAVASDELCLSRAAPAGLLLGATCSRVVTRLAIDHLRSARVRRETYAGEWLPEPVITDSTDDSAQQAEMADSLSPAFLVVLLERASHRSSEHSCCCTTCLTTTAHRSPRSSASERWPRARSPAARAGTQNSASRATRPPGSAATSWRTGFSSRSATGTWRRSRPCPRTMSSSTVTAAAGWQTAVCPRWPVPCGVRRVARTLARGIRTVERADGFEVHRAEINGEPDALITGPDGGLIAVWSLGITEDRVQLVARWSIPTAGPPGIRPRDRLYETGGRLYALARGHVEDQCGA